MSLLKESILKGKDLLPKFFPFREDPFLQRTWTESHRSYLPSLTIWVNVYLYRVCSWPMFLTVHQHLRWMNTNGDFAATFSKGDNFSRHKVASLVFKTFQNWQLLLKERIMFPNSFPLRIAQMRMEANFTLSELFPLDKYQFAIKPEVACKPILYTIYIVVYLVNSEGPMYSALNKKLSWMKKY